MKSRPVNRFCVLRILVGAALLLTALMGLVSCTPNSSSSSGTQTAPSGTGSFETHWKINVAPAQSSMNQSVATFTSNSPATLSTTSVVITVTDPSGAPAPNGSTVSLTCSNGAFGFRLIASGYDYAQPITTDSRYLTNGKVWVDFIAGFSPGTGAINATFQGVTATAAINILETPRNQ
ncbi:MAG: hypothetical protein HY892_14670 [Deltaproteobacteria bacterium]|nr:hypothetical protein [Deltaproteobacteria bacterium]